LKLGVLRGGGYAVRRFAVRVAVSRIILPTANRVTA
jgi:hypothetical protein